MLRSFRTVLLLPLLACAHAASATPVWFVIAEVSPSEGDSAVIPMTRAVDIAEARRQVAEGRRPHRGAPTARIAAGSDGVNRDVLRPGEPLWSWRVTEFIGFGDAFAGTCQASPSGIQAAVDDFIDLSQGEACFLWYTVVAELPGTEHIVGTDDPVNHPAHAISQATDGAWFDPLTPGQGVFLDVLDEQRLALGWFAFDPDAAGTQRWWTAVGEYVGENAAVSIFRTSNGAFAAPDPVETTEIGMANLTFADCNHATLVFVFYQGFHQGISGTIPLERAVHVPDC